MMPSRSIIHNVSLKSELTRDLRGEATFLLQHETASRADFVNTINGKGLNID